MQTFWFQHSPSFGWGSLIWLYFTIIVFLNARASLVTSHWWFLFLQLSFGYVQSCRSRFYLFRRFVGLDEILQICTIVCIFIVLLVCCSLCFFDHVALDCFYGGFVVAVLNKFCRFGRNLSFSLSFLFICKRSVSSFIIKGFIHYCFIVHVRCHGLLGLVFFFSFLLSRQKNMRVTKNEFFIG